MGDFSFSEREKLKRSLFLSTGFIFFAFFSYTGTYKSSVKGKSSKELVGCQSVLQDALTDAF